MAALGSAVFLSLTSIFISYLNIHFQLPALILAFWREIFVALILLVIFLLFSSRCFSKGAQAPPALPGCLWIRPGAFQRVMDHFGGAERRGGRHGAVLLLGGFHCPAGLVDPERIPDCSKKSVAVILSLTGCALDRECA